MTTPEEWVKRYCYSLKGVQPETIREIQTDAIEAEKHRAVELTSALQDAVNVFLEADEAPGQVLCTGERREKWEEVLRQHGRLAR